jgi:hypothetical protein
MNSASGKQIPCLSAEDGQQGFEEAARGRPDHQRCNNAKGCGISSYLFDRMKSEKSIILLVSALRRTRPVFGRIQRLEPTIWRSFDSEAGGSTR